MSHLLRFRKGWENERLAAYLLSRFSFVAHPASVADDLGSDFFCTIFEVRNESETDSLIPRKSFAIQIKSNADKFEVDNKIVYLESLELPFFIGAIRQSPPEMTIYSAEFLPLLFSKHGKPEALSLAPVDAATFDFNKYFEVMDSGRVLLWCPSVVTLSVVDDRSILSRKVDALLQICRRGHSNIAARVSNEHIYEIDGSGHMQIMAGSGSVQVFRANFLKRLAEVFYNLDWTLDNLPDQFIAEEFRVFEKLYLDLAVLKPYHSLLPYVSDVYSRLKAKLPQTNSVVDTHQV